MMEYKQRLSDTELRRKLGAAGAVLIRGPKACGKTESAKQVAKSILNVDRDVQVPILMGTAPERLLLGDTPRLIDEWQVEPRLWNFIRHEVDDRKKAGQFILTGSANPDQSADMHSGAGRFAVVDMRTLSWHELGLSTGRVSLGKLFEGEAVGVADEPTPLELIVDRIVMGGFPGLLNKSMSQAVDVNKAYIELLAEVDMSRVSGSKRDPVKIRSLLRSLARNTTTLVEISTLQRDISQEDNTSTSRPTVYNYLDALYRLMILEDQPAWNTHIRSSAQLRNSPKWHFTDVSLAVAALGLDAAALLSDLRYVGFLFESLVTHDLRVYGQVNGAKVYHYRDSSKLEVDAIVQKDNGDWCAFEIKLGVDRIEDAATSLKKFAALLDVKRVSPPKSLNIITGTGISYTRKDGINVISIASLGA